MKDAKINCFTIKFFSFNLVSKVLDKNDDNNAYMSHVGFQKKYN
jgi:hypothetical protein